MNAEPPRYAAGNDGHEAVFRKYAALTRLNLAP